ncbi:hypothetical protein [Massilia sp. ST3]|uniref:hypothetical protein n=1 Tax=Massilia sp. ST3 TaxID=2824903 RepID=UPI001B83F88C|nr:hypothetical protein [Massilia sp. ST3]MBQ5947946.1 hypothetical protein [Massilia sp. ST3]
MNDPTKADPPNSRRGIFDEADIGSGEKSPGQHETEEMIREIPPLPPSNRQADEGSRQQDEAGKDDTGKGKDTGAGSPQGEPGNRQASGA